jgi:hypothetical protein
VLALQEPRIGTVRAMHTMRPPSLHCQSGRRRRPHMRPLLSTADRHVFAMRENQAVPLGEDRHSALRFLRAQPAPT